MSVTSSSVEAGAAELFAAPGPGWPGACHHSPDLLLAAGSIDEILAGRCTAVLGEIHIALNTLMQPVFTDLHPQPGELASIIERTTRNPSDNGRSVAGAVPARLQPRLDDNWHVEFERALLVPRSRVLGSALSS